MSSSASGPSSESKKPKIISLGGLVNKGSTNSTTTSTSFPSFRFSPDSEEIEEIREKIEETTPDEFGESQSLPESPKQTPGGTGGDVSPLKEYLKHKWANKWDKRSMSLDLDLKGKIIKGIEDRMSRKSIVSHFIPEEPGILPQNPIVEYVGEEVANGNNGNGNSHKDRSTSVYRFSATEQQLYSEDTLSFDFPEPAQEMTNENFEMVNSEHVDNLPFSLSPSQLVEFFSEDHFPRSPTPDPVTTQDLTVEHLLFSMAYSVCSHEWIKYFIPIFAIAVFLPLGFMTNILFFICGIMIATIFNQGLTREVPKNQETPKLSPLVLPSSRANKYQEDLSQGWMTEMEGDYDPLTYKLTMGRVLFAKLEGSKLTLSYPHSKHRIPKRRLFNDPPITTEFNFNKHTIYNLSGAHVYLAPVGLSKKRTWSKKYPIAITLPPNSVSSLISPSESTDSLDGESRDPPHAIKKKEIMREDCGERTLYFFTRTDREKDAWLRRLLNGASHGPQISPLAKEGEDANLLIHYRDYLRRILPDSAFSEYAPIFDSSSSGQTTSQASQSPGSSSSSRKGTPTPDIDHVITVPQSPLFLNAFLGRIFYDFLRSPYWKEVVHGMIQKKFNYIRRPAFLEQLIVKELDLGTAIPIIHRASNPTVDSQGLWIDLDISYEGNLSVTLETKLNLLKLRKSPSLDEPEVLYSAIAGNNKHMEEKGVQAFSSVPVIGQGSKELANAKQEERTERKERKEEQPTPTMNSPHLKTYLFDSEADDSGESSEDEFDPDEVVAHHGGNEGNNAGGNGSIEPGSFSDSAVQQNSKGKKILRIAERFVSSKYGQVAADLGVVKKAIGHVANTPICLGVSLKSCAGTLALNIPPPPTDRLWFGFRTNPMMTIAAKPKFGDRFINLTQVTDWIQKKLILEFQRVAVMPNMNDVPIALLEHRIPTTS